MFLVVLGAATFGEPSPTENLAPVVLYVLFWVGLTVVCGLIGDVWNAGLNPYPTIGGLLAPPSPAPYGLGHWPAAAGLLAFVWLELVAPSRAEPRLLAILVVVYSAVVLAGAVRWGRPWLRDGETFGAWFGLLGRMAPLGPDGPRKPLAGLAALVPRPGTIALVLVALGSTAFDGMTRSSTWTDLVGDRSTDEVVPLATVGLLFAIALVAALYFGAMKVASAMTGERTLRLADAFVHSLVPIAFAYAVAHYFSLLVLEGQAAIALGQRSVRPGLGPVRDRRPDRSTTRSCRRTGSPTSRWRRSSPATSPASSSPTTGRSRCFPKAVATKSQYPLLVAMVAFTVGGLALLLGG